MTKSNWIKSQRKICRKILHYYIVFSPNESTNIKIVFPLFCWPNYNIPNNRYRINCPSHLYRIKTKCYMKIFKPIIGSYFFWYWISPSKRHLLSKSNIPRCCYHKISTTCRNNHNDTTIYTKIQIRAYKI